MKKLIILISLFSLASCQSFLQAEAEKSARANSASSRINASDSNNSDLFKELDN